MGRLEERELRGLATKNIKVTWKKESQHVVFIVTSFSTVIGQTFPEPAFCVTFYDDVSGPVLLWASYSNILWLASRVGWWELYLDVAHELHHGVGLAPVFPPLALQAGVAQVVHLGLRVRLHGGQLVLSATSMLRKVTKMVKNYNFKTTELALLPWNRHVTSIPSFLGLTF